jgi:NitT/TauT family transport system permease protein
MVESAAKKSAMENATDAEFPRKKSVWGHLGASTLQVVQPLLTLILFLILWQIIVMAFDIPKFIIPAPLDIIEKGITMAPKIWVNYWSTLRSAFLGYLLAVGIAVPGSLVIAYSVFAERTVYPMLVMIDMTPKVTLAPIILVWLGFGIAPKLVVTFLVCFFPIILNGILGFRSINPEIVYLSQSAGASPWTMFWKVRLPNALPTLFVGLKYGASLAMIGAVVSEFIGGNSGLGYYLIVALDHMQVDVGMAIMVAMTTIGLGMFFSVAGLESLLIPWHVSKRKTHSD